MDMSLLPDEFSDTETLTILSGNTESCSADSPAGKMLLRSRRNGLLHLAAKEVWKSAVRGYRGRRSDDVSALYGTAYVEDPLVVANPDYSSERINVYRLGNKSLLHSRASEILRLWTHRLGDILGALNQQTVCEVGSGNGRNLLCLANRFPNTSFSGFELSPAGAQAARQLQTIDLPNTAYGRLYGITPRGMDNVGRIKFQQGSAFDLPIGDKSSDVVYTFAALEQMHDGLEKALSEVRRITRTYSLFFEPFWEYNDPASRLYLWSRNYFRLRTADLRKHGFELIKTWHMVPVKPTFAYAFCLCRPV